VRNVEVVAGGRHLICRHPRLLPAAAD
jgi:hypothetical protein